jgi:hypothetical protein
VPPGCSCGVVLAALFLRCGRSPPPRRCRQSPPPRRPRRRRRPDGRIGDPLILASGRTQLAQNAPFRVVPTKRNHPATWAIARPTVVPVAIEQGQATVPPVANRAGPGHRPASRRSRRPTTAVAGRPHSPTPPACPRATSLSWWFQPSGTIRSTPPDLASRAVAAHPAGTGELQHPFRGSSNEAE